MPDAAAETNPTGDQTRIEEQLVAYLDGELDDADARRIEELLASDAEVRQTLEKLEATWGLLDHLDQAHVDEVFTQSTLEMVAVAAAEDVQKQQAEAPRLRRRRCRCRTPRRCSSRLPPCCGWVKPCACAAGPRSWSASSACW